MKKKIVSLLFALLSTICFLFGFASCDDKHTHDFLEIVRIDCLKSEATCAHKEIYYKSCLCGAIGEETFEYGSLLPHPYKEEWNYDETHHWHDTTCACNEKVDYAEHTVDGYPGFCSVCEKTIQATNGVKYAVSGYGEYVTVVDYTGTSKKVNIASTYNGLPVKKIGDSAFLGCSSLTSITIPNSVTSIGDRAFEDCSSLTSITVDSRNQNYKSIDGNLYSKDGKTLVQYAIGKKATSFVIPDSVTSIGEYAFYNCSRLTNIYYQGTESEWDNIFISYSNDSLTSATRYYYSESKPTTKGNYWHYGESGNIVVW